MKNSSITTGFLFGLLAHAGVASAELVAVGDDPLIYIDIRELRALAEQGEPDAHYELGVMYDEGLGVAEDDGEAFVWFSKAAEQGDDTAKTQLGRLSSELEGKIADLAEIYVWVQFTTERDENAAGIAESLLGHIDQTERIETLISLGSELVDRGFLGQAYKLFSLVAVSYDHKEAGSLAEKIHGRMEQDERVQAFFELGSIYETGRPGLPGDHGSAANWYRKAAEQDHSDAQYRLGLMYNEGKGGEADIVQAYAWSNLAAATGDSSAIELRDDTLVRMAWSEVNEAQALSREIEAVIESSTSR